MAYLPNTNSSLRALAASFTHKIKQLDSQRQSRLSEIVTRVKNTPNYLSNKLRPLELREVSRLEIPFRSQGCHGVVQAVMVRAVDTESKFHTLLGAQKMPFNNNVAINALSRERGALLKSTERPHPNLQRLLCVSDDTVILPLAQGSLAQRLERPVCLSKKLDWASETCKGLAHLHKLGFLHLDIKPDNVLVSHENEAVLSDLGGNTLQTIRDPSIGFLGHAFPENDRDITKRADIYGMACLAYKLITGVDLASYQPNRTVSRPSLPMFTDFLIDQLRGKAEPKAIAQFTRTIMRALDPDPKVRPQLSVLLQSLDQLRGALRPSGEVTKSNGDLVKGILRTPREAVPDYDDVPQGPRETLQNGMRKVAFDRVQFSDWKPSLKL